MLVSLGYHLKGRDVVLIPSKAVVVEGFQNMNIYIKCKQEQHFAFFDLDTLINIFQTFLFFA